MGTPEEAPQRAATTYNAALDSYDHPANALALSMLFLAMAGCAGPKPETKCLDDRRNGS